MLNRPEILVHPNVPKPLHGLNPRSILGAEWWDTQRHAVYAKQEYCCAACGVHKSKAKKHKWIEAHEFYEYDYANGIGRMVEIVALCHYCHNFIHSGRLSVMRDRGQITMALFNEIMAHGTKILADAGLKPWKPTDERIQQDWSKWHIIIDGEKYYSKFSCYADWNAFYGR